MGPLVLVVGGLTVVQPTLRRHLCLCHSQLRLALHCCFLFIRRQPPPLARRHCPFCHTQSDRCLHFPLRNKLLQLPWRSLVLSSDESTPVFRWMHYQCKHEIIIIEQEITETRIHKLTSCSRHGHDRKYDHNVIENNILHPFTFVPAILLLLVYHLVS